MPSSLRKLLESLKAIPQSSIESDALVVLKYIFLKRGTRRKR